MIDYVTIIKNDDIDTFKKHFNQQEWQKTITQIPNYAGITPHTPTLTYNDADCIKYALHCESDKIFEYLLPLVDTDKHGNNYGWPLLAMALLRNRYDYAYQIINHNTFNPYPIYHHNVFLNIQSRSNVNQHIAFLFDYLEKFSPTDFIYSIRDIAFMCVQLVCYNEDTYNEFEKFYKKITDNPKVTILDYYKPNIDILGNEIIYRRYKSFVLEKLSPEYIKNIIEHDSVMNNNIFLSQIFKKNNTEGLNYLLKAPDALVKYLTKNPTDMFYLSLNNAIKILDTGIDIWSENEKGIAIIDFMLHKVNEKLLNYLVVNYTKPLIARFKNHTKHKNVVQQCEQYLLNQHKTLKI